MFDIVFSTVNRKAKKQYLFDTLESFFNQTSSLPKTHLVVGNTDIVYLTPLKDNSSLNIIPITEEEWSLAKGKGKCDKFNLNFYRCLTQQVDSSLIGRLYLEDDISFKKDWDNTLKNLITRIKQTVPEFALSLYTAHGLYHNKEEIIEFKRGFYGTQGVFFTSGIMKGFANYIMDNGILTYKSMADILLQQYCLQENIPLYVIKDSLVQHTGEESIIHGNHFHKSVNFKSE